MPQIAPSYTRTSTSSTQVNDNSPMFKLRIMARSELRVKREKAQNFLISLSRAGAEWFARGGAALINDFERRQDPCPPRHRRV